MPYSAADTVAEVSFFKEKNTEYSHESGLGLNVLQTLWNRPTCVRKIYILVLCTVKSYINPTTHKDTP